MDAGVPRSLSSEFQALSMKKQEKTHLNPGKYRCPLCKQWVSSVDYLYTRRRTAAGA
jgi:hypothetical protein